MYFIKKTTTQHLTYLILIYFFSTARNNDQIYIKDSRARVVRRIRSVPGSITADRLNNMQIWFAPILEYIYIYVHLFRVCAYPDAGNNLSFKSNGNRMNSIIRLWRVCMCFRTVEARAFSYWWDVNERRLMRHASRINDMEGNSWTLVRMLNRILFYIYKGEISSRRKQVSRPQPFPSLVQCGIDH